MSKGIGVLIQLCPGGRLYRLDTLCSRGTGVHIFMLIKPINIIIRHHFHEKFVILYVLNAKEAVNTKKQLSILALIMSST